MSVLKLVLNRAFKTPHSVGGCLFSPEHGHICYTLEPNVSEERPKGCIPSGTYKVKITYSPKFKRYLPRLFDVPNFDGILIHGGNFWYHSLGCILVGQSKPNCEVLSNSQKTLSNLMDIIKRYDECYITIND